MAGPPLPSTPPPADGVTWLRHEDVLQRLERAGRAAMTAVHAWHSKGGAVFPIATLDTGVRLPLPLAAASTLRQAERACRAEAALKSHAIGHPVSVVGPLGLTRTIAALSGLGMSGCCLEWGPYVPIEGRDALRADIAARLESLGLEDGSHEDAVEQLAQTVAILSASAVEHIAEWCLADLASLAQQHAVPTVREGAGPDFSGSNTLRRHEPRAGIGRFTEHGMARTAALAMAAGDRAALRQAVHTAFGEIESRPRTAAGERKATALAFVAAVLVQAEHAGLETEHLWEGLPSVTQRLKQTASVRGEVRAVCGFLLPAPPGVDGARDPAVFAQDPAIAPLHALVRERLAEGIPLREAARVVGESPSAITHRLQRRFGLSYTQYVKRLRVDAAKALLRETGLSVSEVGRRVGIDDPSNFAKVFRACEAMSPGEYRARYRQPSRAPSI